MNCSRLLLCLVGLSACFVVSMAIINGVKAPKDRFPYQVAILDPHLGLVCGGSIIREQFVLTASYCVVHEDGSFRGIHIKALTGTNNVLKTSEPADEVPVSKIYVAVEYTPWLDRNTAEIAVLKLQRPFKFSQHINRVELPHRGYKEDHRRAAIISGFGWDKVKMLNDEPVADSSNYQLLYSGADLFDETIAHQFSHKHILARTHQYVIYPKVTKPRNRSTCVGDLGGPLVQDHYLIGVLTSIPHGCSEANIPSTYARVADSLNFIQDAILDRSHMFMRAYTLEP